MKLINKIIYTGIWTQPIAMALEIEWLTSQGSLQEMTLKQVISLLLLSCLPSAYIYINNSAAYANGKRKFGLLDAFNHRPDPFYSTEKKKAMYPEVPKSLICHVKPQGIVLGKYHQRYVCKEIGDDAHYLIIGGSGSGKSSALVIPTLLVNQTVPAFVIDIKGELSRLTQKKGDKNVRIFNPNDRMSYGYDPFCRLTKNSNEQEIYETMQMITFSLIPLSSSVKDPFWKTSARNMLCGLLIYYYKQGKHNLVDIIDVILGKPILETVLDIMKLASPQSVEYRYLVQFSDMAEETLSGVFAEMANNLIIFSNDQDIRFAFKNNPAKCSAKDLKEGYSIYIVIREDKLAAYSHILQCIINQTLEELEKRPENAAPILLLIDELPRILSAGKLHRLLDASRTLRSRNVRLMLVTQSVEALMTVYTENEVVDLISNCAYKIILDASSQKTQHMVGEWCGKYKEKKKSWNGTGSKQKTGITYEEKPIVEPSDLMTLAQSGDAILISPYGYHRIQKAPYYKDTYLKGLADAVAKHNQVIEDLDHVEGGNEK